VTLFAANGADCEGLEATLDAIILAHGSLLVTE
jgi:hypothetical protein